MKKKNIDIFCDTLRKNCDIIKDIDYIKLGKYYLIHIYFKLEYIHIFRTYNNKFNCNARISFGRVYYDYEFTSKELMLKLDDLIKIFNILQSTYMELINEKRRKVK